MIEPFEKEKCGVRLYSVREDFSPDLTGIPEDDWVVLINYYGQIDNEKIREIAGTHPRLIVDNTRAYFQMPVAGLDTVYTCRKFFGVTDGAILYTDKPMEEDFPTDESFERMTYILGRFERTAQEFYELYDKNNSFFENEPIKKMSKLTHNILCGIDYDFIRARRAENFRYLNDRLGDMNALKLKNPDGAFMYPFLVEGGVRIRKQLQAEKIYIPTLWPDVFHYCGENETEYYYAGNILPLPVDQRYDIQDMEYIVNEVLKAVGNSKA